MNPEQKLNVLLENDIQPTPIDKINDNPEDRIEEFSVDVFSEEGPPHNFEVMVNPSTGKINKDSLMQMTKEFSGRNRDTIIMKSDDDAVGFYGIDRDSLSSYFSGLEGDSHDEAKKYFSDNVEMVYSREGSEMMFQDYYDLVYDNVVSINRMDFESDITGPSSNVPDVVMNNGI